MYNFIKRKTAPEELSKNGKRKKRNSFSTVITATCVSTYMIWQVRNLKERKLRIYRHTLL